MAINNHSPAGSQPLPGHGETGNVTGDGVLRLGEMIDCPPEDSLHETAHLLVNIIESSPDATLVIDKKGKVLFWNRAMAELTGYPAAEMVGQGHYEHGRAFYKGVRRPMLVDMIVDPDLDISHMFASFYREGDVLVTDLNFADLKGEDKVMWGRAAPLYNSQGKIVGAIETVRDITERQQAADALKKSHEQLQLLFDSTVHALAITTEKRDQYTAGHQLRVADLACAIGEEMGLAEDVIRNLRIAGSLHDIGKLFVPLDILSQPSKLNNIERLFVMTHSEAGYDILKDIPFEGPIPLIIMQHHERMDGSGYPLGLKGSEILLEARILAVADTFEAMASHRPYRPSLGIEKAIAEITDHAGTIYDAEVVNACLKVVRGDQFHFE
ncbi:MAG: PAS domain S-box protein [Syntrophomonadaceae bacterium]|nr:PAS domain S-box protein [Syntrophomonadaceae bacterium]